MQLFGWTIARTKALSPVYSNRGWLSLIHEPFAGAWQRNIEVKADTALSYSAVYACVTLIASDIGKLRLRLVQQDSNGIWTETENAAHSPVLRKPNRYQTRIKFFENWITSKLNHGNTYVLKQRDNRNVVTALYVLDPCRTRVLVADDGAVFYELNRDNLTGQTAETVVVPASEIIHDTMTPLYHPLVGVSPISACGLSALHGLNIQKNSTQFFQNGARPAGILSTATAISDEKAKEFQDRWNAKFRDGGLGGTAVLGGDWKFTTMSMTAVDAQLIEQLKISAETVCSCFHVPPYKIGAAPPPPYNNVEALNQEYYNQCLQTHIENIELLLDEGLDLKKSQDGRQYGTEFDISDLLRMDTATRVKAAADAVGSGAMSPNEARKKYFDLGPVKGGQSPYLQQQNFSLAALDERDQDKPFAKPAAPPPGSTAPTPEPDDAEVEDADAGDDEERAIDLVEIAPGVWQPVGFVNDVQRALAYVRTAP